MTEEPAACRHRYWHVETDYEVLPARVGIPLRGSSESPKAARVRRAQAFVEARTLPRIEGARVTLWDIEPSFVNLDVAQRDPVRVPLMPQHTCCPPPDSEGRVYTRCGMTAYECASYEWF